MFGERRMVCSAYACAHSVFQAMNGMRMIRYRYLFPILLLLICAEARAQVTSCDDDPSCVGNMLTIEETSGRNAQYVDVDTRNPLRRLSTAMTFEAWLNPTEQPGKKVFVGGLWGPNQDNNDQWVVFIQGTQITFELNHPDYKLGRTDNTVVTVDVPDLYTRGWFHLAAAWDGTTTAARLYVDGIKLGENSNPNYPLTQLHTIERSSLQTQIAGTNALYDNQNQNRTFLGNMDEIRIWNRSLSDVEIRCQHTKSLVGNESGLILYYRCNDNENSQNLCDATGNAHWGRLRSGAHIEVSMREVPPSFSVTPTAPINTALNCTADTTFSFTLTDTTFCGSDLRISVTGRDSALFALSATSMQLTQNNPRLLTARINAAITGDIEAELHIRASDRCGANITIPINLRRTTELSYSQTRVELDTLFVDCKEKTYSEDTIEICNTTGRNLSIYSAAITNGGIFSTRPADPARPLPQSLAPGDCWSVIIRANAFDTTRTLFDTLRIASDDQCPGSGVVPVQTHTQDVLVLLDGNGNNRLDRGAELDFGSVCPAQVSDVRLYQFRNLASDTAFIDSIWFNTPEFYTRRQTYPIPAPPEFAFRPDYIRFRPLSAGTKFDSIHVRAIFRGCTIVKTIALTGYGFDVNNGFDEAALNYGNVTVGKISQLTATAYNDGDPARFTAYLKVGDAFRITSARSFQLGKGERRGVDVEFRPREDRTYYDTLCIFDQQCYGTSCIPISGTGVFDQLSFDPSFVELEDVIGCQCKRDTVTIENISGAAVSITNVRLNDPASTGKFTLTGATSANLSPGQSGDYIIEYCPNDLQSDRADVAYIDVTLSDGQLYQILIRASSVVPRLYVEPLTAFGTVEAGWQAQQRILIENISSVPIDVPAGGITLPAGYSILGTTPNLPTTLNPRDSLWVDVEFAPTAEQNYNDSIRVNVNTPCPITYAGAIEGKGKVVKLDVPVTFINFGLNKVCDCTEREIPLPNNSEFVPMNIDSIWIDAGGLANAQPGSFSWRSRQTGGSSVPYTIAPQSADTLVLTFCPAGISDTSNVINNARVHIQASTTVWSEEFVTTISGRREINFLPNRTVRGFATTRVDVQAPNSAVWLSVPDQFLNPSGDSVIITDVTFAPDDRVFTAWAANGDPLPWVIRRGESFRVNLGFRPRAPKLYTAKMVLHTEFPCRGIDTSVTVRGEGFAPAFGMQFAFDTANLGQDTFRLSTCDTLVLPIMIDRDMPQNLIDILFHIGYDTASLDFYDISSPYTSTASVVDTGDGAYANVKDARDVLAGEVAYLRFLVKGSPNAFPITLDAIDFDSDSLVLFRIVAGYDDGWVIVDEPMIAMSGLTAFDTVNVKTCADREVVVWNPGVLPVQFDSLALPRDHRITASDIPFPTTLQPGDSIRLTVSFCPTVDSLYDQDISSFATAPCVITDTGALYSFGYAPPWPIKLEIAEDPVMGMIADTMSVTITADRYMPVAPIDLQFSLAYNRRSLQFMEIESPYSESVSATVTQRGLDITVPGIDSLDAGELATLKFVFAVPDTVVTQMMVEENSIAFSSDSIFFVKPVPTGDTSTVQVDPRCNITLLTFRGGVTNKLSAPTPNPAKGTVTVEAQFFEDAPATLILYDALGREVMRLLEGNGIMPGGRYLLEFDVSDLPSGEYFYVLEANHFRATERLRIAR